MEVGLRKRLRKSPRFGPEQPEQGARYSWDGPDTQALKVGMNKDEGGSYKQRQDPAPEPVW